MIKSIFLSARFFLLFLLALALPSPPCSAAQPAEWTVMVYMCGDNNLEQAAIMDMLEMEQSIPQGVEVLVLLDRSKGYTQLLGDWSDARLYRIRRAQPFDIAPAATMMGGKIPAAFASQMLEDWGEVDMSDPATLTRFIKTCAASFPAKRYAIVPWNHGGGWKGLLQDEDGGNGGPGKGIMNIGEFVQAARFAAQDLPRKRFDLAKFELCLMGQLDVMAETMQLADYAFASPPEEPGQGSDYVSILPLFGSNLSTAELTAKMVDINIDYYTRLGIPAAFAAYDLSQMRDVVTRMRGLTSVLMGHVSTHYTELTRATCFSTHYANYTEDITRGKNAVSCVELDDWLSRLESEVPGFSAEAAKLLRESVSKLVYHASATPDLIDYCKGATLYLPLRRENVDDQYRATAFAQASGMADYLAALYSAQEMQGTEKPRITNIAMGAPHLRPGTDGSNEADFDIGPISSLVPFSRHAIRFDVTGKGILWTKLMQFERHGKDLILNFVQIVTDHNKKDTRKESNLLKANSPVYNDGTTTLLREVEGVNYKVSNGQDIATITIENTKISDQIAENVCIGYGMYTDSTMNGKEILVQVSFSNVMLIPIKIIGIVQDAQGRVIGTRGISLQAGGTFRPGVIVLDSKLQERRVFGKPISLPQGMMFITVGMVDQGAQIGYLIAAETMDGKKAFGMSNVLPVQYNAEQMRMLQNTMQHGLEALPGRYAMVHYAQGADGIDELPTFQTLELNVGGNNASWSLNNGKQTFSGPMKWTFSGVPQISLHKKPTRKGILLGQTVQTWYTFLQGSGAQRVWYCIGMGDGTRWGFFPMERYNAGTLDGTWTSKTEKWVFKGNTVTLTRDGHTGSGTFNVHDNIAVMTGMPAKEYAFHASPEEGRLTLISRKGVASILTREGFTPKPAAQQPNPQPQPGWGQPQQQPGWGQPPQPGGYPQPAPADPMQALQGAWSGSDGNTSILLMFMGNTCGLNMNGQQLFGTWNAIGNRLNMQMQNGRTLSYSFAIQGDTLVLDGTMRLMRQPMPGQNTQPGGWNQPQPPQPGWNQPQQPNWGQPQNPQNGWNQPQQPVDPYQALQGAWAGTDGSVNIILMFQGNMCGLNMNGQQTTGTWSLAGNRINMQLQNGRSVSYTYALQGDMLILGGSVRLMRQQMLGQNTQPGGWNQPQQPNWGQPQNPQNGWNQPQQPNGWNQPQNPQPGWNQPQQPNWGQQPPTQSSILTGRWASIANTSKAYMILVFTNDLCISYFNGEELERSRYSYANGQLTQHMLTGKAAGKTLVWNCQVNGNRMVISLPGMQPMVWQRQ